MADPRVTTPGAPAPGQTTYRPRVAGLLGEFACDYVADLALAVTATPPARTVTTLTCALPDRAALVRLINPLHDFGLSLAPVERPGARPWPCRSLSWPLPLRTRHLRRRAACWRDRWTVPTTTMPG